MDKAYMRIDWKNKDVSKSTPINATNLNRMDEAIDVIDNRVVELDLIASTADSKSTQVASDLDEYETSNDAALEVLRQAISSIPKFEIKVVETLPTENISPTTVYLVPNSSSSETDMYDEWIYANSKWEHLGSQTIDLRDYMKKSGGTFTGNVRFDDASIEFFDDGTYQGRLGNDGSADFRSVNSREIYGILGEFNHLKSEYVNPITIKETEDSTCYTEIGEDSIRCYNTSLSISSNQSDLNLYAKYDIDIVSNEYNSGIRIRDDVIGFEVNGKNDVLTVSEIGVTSKSFTEPVIKTLGSGDNIAVLAKGTYKLFGINGIINMPANIPEGMEYGGLRIYVQNYLCADLYLMKGDYSNKRQWHGVIHDGTVTWEEVGSGGGSAEWTGTKSEYEEQKDTIPEGMIVNITDDYVEPTSLATQEELSQLSESMTENYSELKQDLENANAVIDLLVEASEGTIMYDDVQTNFAKEVTVPSKSLSTAKVNMIGGMSRKGKNLINPTSVTTVAGVTITKNRDNSLTFNGTVLETSEVKLFTNLNLNGTYKLVGCPSGGAMDSYYLLARNSSWNKIIRDMGNGGTYTFSSDMQVVSFYMYKDCVFNNFILKPMITEDLSATYADYEPYTSSLIDAKVDEIVTSGVNLFDVETMAHEQRAAAVFSVGSNIFEENFSNSRTSATIPVKPNTTYTIKPFNFLMGNVLYANSNGISTKVINLGWHDNSVTLTTDSDTAYIYTMVKTESDNYVSKSNMKFVLCYGTTISEYTPYMHSTTTIPTAITELPDWGKGINENCFNYVDLESGKYHHRVGSCLLKDLNFSITSENRHQFAAIDLEGLIKPLSVNCICSDCDVTSVANAWNKNETSLYKCVAVTINGKLEYYSGESTVSELKNYLNNNNVKLYYELAEEEVIDVDPITMYIPVEANGKVQVHYPNCDVYDVNVPSTITFPCKIGGSNE